MGLVAVVMSVYPSAQVKVRLIAEDKVLQQIRILVELWQMFFSIVVTD